MDRAIFDNRPLEELSRELDERRQVQDLKAWRREQQDFWRTLTPMGAPRPTRQRSRSAGGRRGEPGSLSLR
eukprot:4496662-Prymnesium_polylepis.2